MKKSLITFVGDSDPIRNFHDGSLLHIARHYRPEQICIIYSEHTYAKHKNITEALRSIAGYHPQILINEEIISNNSVWKYNEMFSYFKDYLTNNIDFKDTEVLLNISSGTPQVKSSLFALKHMLDIPATLIQVTTPIHDSNAGTGHDNLESIELLIETNEDRTNPKETNRCQEIEGRAFRQQLLILKVKDMLDNYDYHAVEKFLISEMNIPNRSLILKNVQKINNNLNTQTVPSDFLRKAAEDTRKVVHYYLVIKMSLDRGDVSNGLVRLKSFAEFLLYNYINKSYPGLIQVSYDGKLEVNQTKLKSFGIRTSTKLTFANLYSYYQILKAKEKRSMAFEFAGALLQINNSRNTIAHSLDKISKDEVKGLGHELKTCKKFMDSQFEYDKKILNYYQNKNIQIIHWLNSCSDVQ